MKNRKNLDQAEPLLNNCSEFWNNLFKTKLLQHDTNSHNWLGLRMAILLVWNNKICWDFFTQNFVNHVEKLLISEPESFCIFSKNLLLMSSFSIEQKHIFLGHEELSKNLGDKFSHTRSRQFFPLPSVYVSISGCADKGFMPLSNEQTEKDWILKINLKSGSFGIVWARASSAAVTPVHASASDIYRSRFQLISAVLLTTPEF